MRTDLRYLALATLLPALSACETAHPEPHASHFGDANRQTMMAQVVDPDPYYDDLNPPTSGEHAGQAVERYRKDAVKRPDRISTSSGPN